MARRSKKKEDKRILNIQVAGLILIGILLAVLIYTKSGYIGETLSPILGGIMGWIKYIIPIGIFAIAIFVAKEEEIDSFSKKIFQYAVLLLCITVVITVIQVSRGELNIYNNKFETVVEEAYYQGTRNLGGGAVGAVFAFGLIKLIRKNWSSYICNWCCSNRFYFPFWN